MTTVLPASQTKHLPFLIHPIPRNPTITLELQQITATSSTLSSSSSSQPSRTGTGTTGTTLWSSSQVLSAYLSSLPTITSPSRSTFRNILELGSGVGYLSLCLASWGWNVTTSDIEPVLSTVLAPNIEKNLSKLYSGSIDVVEVDWTDQLPDGLRGEYDMIITADTIYHPPLILPLFNTIKQICERQKAIPVIYLGLERRDSRLVDTALEGGRSVGFEITRIGRGRVQKALDRAGWTQTRKVGRAVGNEGEDDEEDGGEDADENWGWDGVEIWKARYKGHLA